MKVPFGLVIGSDFAETWVMRCLRQGTPLALKVSQELWRPGVAVLLVPPEFKGRQIEPLSTGKYVKTSDSMYVAVEFLDWARERGAKTLLVESDVQRRGDHSAHGAGVAFIDNRVVRWIDLDAGSEEASLLLRSGATGHPLNAFVCEDSASGLGLVAEGEVGDEGLKAVVESLVGIVVGAFDTESFVTWLRPDPVEAEVATDFGRAMPLSTAALR